MRRGILVVVAVVVVVAAFWLWRRGTRTHSASTREDAGASTHAPGMHEPALPPTQGTPPPPPPFTDDAARAAPPVEPQVNPPSVQARMAEVHARLQEILRPCLTTVAAHPPTDAEFRFSYRLTFANNEASLSDVKLVWSEVSSAELETCFLQKAATAHWTQEEPDGSTTVEDAFRMSDLK